MTGRTDTGNNGREYYCNRRNYTRNDCHEPGVSADAIETQVWFGLKELLSDTERMASELKLAQQRELAEREPKRDELLAIEANIKQTEKQAADLARSVQLIDPDDDDDNIVAKQLRLDIKRTNELYKEQIARRDEIKVELKRQTLTDDVIGDLMQYADDVRSGVLGADNSIRRFCLERLKVRVVVKQGHFNASSILGTWEGDVIRRRELISLRNRGVSIEDSICRPTKCSSM